MRVDNWDEEDEQLPSPTEPREAKPIVEAAPAAEEVELTSATEQEAAGETPVEEPKLTFRQAIGTAPVWLWLIAVMTIGSMCVMFFTIMFLIVAR